MLGLGYGEYILANATWYNDDDAYYEAFEFHVQSVEFTDTEIIITFSNEIDDDMDGIPF